MIETSRFKKTSGLVLIGLSFFILALLPTKTWAQTTPQQGIAAATTQANADAADAATQQQKAQAADTAGNTAAALQASDQAQVDQADIALQQALIAEDTLKEQGGTTQATAVDQAAVNAAAANLQEKKAVQAKDLGDAAGAAQAAANAQTDATAAQQNAVTAGAAPLTSLKSGSGTFVPLTNIPGLFGANSVTNAQGLTAFFNALYKICIGVAATLTVLQLIRAGFMYMGGDSITETKQARALIGTAIGGLLLVLSPVIVFSIINPKILNLQVGFNTLTPGTSTATSATTGTTATPASTATTPAATTAATTAATAQSYSLPVGTYLYLQESYSVANPSCLTLIAVEGANQASCQSQAQAYMVTWNKANPNANSGYSILYNCVAPANGAVSVPAANLCSSQPYF
jgi:hypothetical protein